MDLFLKYVEKFLMNLGRCSISYAVYIVGGQLKKTKRIVHHSYRYRYRSLSSFRTGNGNSYSSLSKIFNKNRNLYNRGQYQPNFTTTCRPTLMAKEIKKGEQSIYSEIPPPPPRERSYIYPIFLLSCLSAGIYVVMTEDKEDIQEEILEAVKSKAEEITYNNQMEQINKMQQKPNPRTNEVDEGTKLMVENPQQKMESSKSSSDNLKNDKENLAIQDSSNILSKKEIVDSGKGWYLGKYIIEFINRK